MGKHILDVTCSNRSIWFDKHCDSAIYCDKRSEHHEGTFGTAKMNLTLDISPDVICDFTDLPFDDESFELVVMDPPPPCGGSEGFIVDKEALRYIE